MALNSSRKQFRSQLEIQHITTNYWQPKYLSFLPARIYDGLEDLFYPMIWFDTSTMITDDYASDLRLVVALEKGVPGFGLALILLGILLLILALYCGLNDYLRWQAKRKTKNESYS